MELEALRGEIMMERERAFERWHVRKIGDGVGGEKVKGASAKRN